MRCMLIYSLSLSLSKLNNIQVDYVSILIFLDYIDYPNECMLLFRVTHYNTLYSTIQFLANENLVGCSHIIEHKWICLVKYYILVE